MGRMPGEVLTASNRGNTVTNVYKRGKRRNYRKRTLNLITASSYLTGSFGFRLTCHCPENLVRVFLSFASAAWRELFRAGLVLVEGISCLLINFFPCHSSFHLQAEPA